MSKEKVIIIIPSYNEEENIANTLNAILMETESLEDFNVEILVFDSQSTDNTANIVRTFTNKGRVHFVEEPQKSGLGSAYLQAMRYAIDTLFADIVFEFDADGSHQPKYIPPMLQLLKNHDVVVGSRYIAGGGIPHDWRFYRKFLSMIGNWIARLFLTNRYKDLTSGFRATRTNILKKILPEKFLTVHYAYKLHLYWLLIEARAKIIEFPIVFLERTKGNSKLPKNSISDTLRVLFTLRFSSCKDK
jgi:dolichol-phosphate mannosyltransferase